MINYQFFPRSHGLTSEMAEVVECFRKVDAARTGGKQISSNEMLALVCPHLEKCKCGFKVESGKAKEGKIDVPVLFGENNAIDKSFFTG